MRMRMGVGPVSRTPVVAFFIFKLTTRSTCVELRRGRDFTEYAFELCHGSRTVEVSRSTAFAGILGRRGFGAFGFCSCFRDFHISDPWLVRLVLTAAGRKRNGQTPTQKRAAHSEALVR